MKSAIFEPSSLNSAGKPESAETGPNSLGTESRKSGDWVPKPSKYGKKPILIGFDTEYQQESANRNQVLSYQFYACLLDGESHWAGIYYPKTGDRIRLAWFLEHVISEGIQNEVLRRWPPKVYLIGHFSIADLTTFEDFDEFKPEFDSIRRTFITIADEMTVTAWDLHRHRHSIRLILRDSMLLAPAGKQALKELGDLVGTKKIELEMGDIERMGELLKRDRARFEEYALRDPEVAVKYCLRILKLNAELFGEHEIPPTLSSIGVSYLLRLWEAQNLDRHVFLGTEEVKERTWSAARQRYITRFVTVPTADRHCYEGLATECYHGGRNEQYFFGPSEAGTWTDFDLCGAYTTAMSLIGMPQWDRIRTTKDLGEFQPDTLGYARVEFRFPENTRFPCLPVRTDNGLIFPLEGESFCCSPEIHLAISMGAQLRIKQGIILPADFEVRPFETFIVECTTRRRSFAKKSLEELFWKELGNGTYGKTAQGLRKKRVFNSRSAEYETMPESRITNPYFAAYVTSFIRAALGEILSRLPLCVQVSNVTTDGFLSTASEEQALLACDGAICRVFAAARLRLCGNIEILEAKHQVAQVLGWRTRGQATLMPLPGKEIVLAKGGLQAPKELKQKSAQNAWIIQTFANRQDTSAQNLTFLRTLPDIYKNGGDLVPREVVRRISMEFDWKRRPITATTRNIGTVPHLYFDTLPWQSVAEHQTCREAWERFSKCNRRTLKTTSDLEGFNDFRLTPIIKGLKTPRSETALKLAKRMFLRALVRSQWGLDGKLLSYRAVSQWLSALGYVIKDSDVENAARPAAKLVPHCVPYTSVTSRFAEAITEKYPSFASENLFRPEEFMNYRARPNT